MAQSFLAQITPIDPTLKPTHPIVIPPDKPGNPPIPTHPIYLPVHPDLKPEHPIFLPPYPSHPIIIPPGGVPGTGGPVDPSYGIEAGLKPAHPIVIPPPPDGATKPPAGGGVTIYLPAQEPTEGGWVLGFVPGSGWVWLQVGGPASVTKPGGDKPPIGVQPKR